MFNILFLHNYHTGDNNNNNNADDLGLVGLLNFEYELL